MKLNAPRMAYLSLISIYFAVPLIHDVIPGYAELKANGWAALLGIYAIGCIAALPMFLQLVKSGGKKPTLIRYFYSRWFICLLTLCLCLVFFWKNSAALYISLPFLIVFSSFLMSVRRVTRPYPSEVFKDSESGSLYIVQSGLNRKLSKSEASAFRAKTPDADIPLIDFDTVESLSSHRAQTDDLIINPSSGLPMVNGIGGIDVAGNTWGNDNFHSGISINPTSGLPMNGVGSGIDIDGGSWGTSSSGLSGPGSSFDSHRGY